MNFRFTVRGLFLLTTIVAVLVSLGLWLVESPLFISVFVYLLIYIGTFTLLYFLRYRHQIKDARAAWKEHLSKRDVLNEAIANKRASLGEPSNEPPLTDSSPR